MTSYGTRRRSKHINTLLHQLLATYKNDKQALLHEEREKQPKAPVNRSVHSHKVTYITIKRQHNHFRFFFTRTLTPLTFFCFLLILSTCVACSLNESSAASDRFCFIFSTSSCVGYLKKTSVAFKTILRSLTLCEPLHQQAKAYSEHVSASSLFVAQLFSTTASPPIQYSYSPRQNCRVNVQFLRESVRNSLISRIEINVCFLRCLLIPLTLRLHLAISMRTRVSLRRQLHAQLQRLHQSLTA